MYQQFILFINASLNKRFEGNVSAFADDMALLYSDKYVLNLCQKKNCDLVILRNRCMQNKMTVKLTLN